MLLENKRTLIVLCLVGLVLGALAMRLMVFERYLPVVDWGDELNMYTLARHWRGVEDFTQNNERLAGYPPMYIWISMGVQEIVDRFSERWVSVPQYIYAMRLIAVVVGTLTTACIITAGWLLGGPLAGWLAGLVWAFSPAIVPYETLAIGDPFIFLLSAVSITCAIRAWQKQSFRWSTASLIAGLLAVFFKYPSFYVLIPWGIVTLGLTVRHARQAWPWLLLHAGVTLGAVAYLVWGYDLFRMHIPEATRFTAIIENDGVLGIFRRPGIANNFGYSLKPFLFPALFYGVMLAGALAFGFNRWKRRKTIDWRVIVVLGLYAYAGIILSTTHTYIHDINRIRFVLPVTVGLALMWALAVTQITYTMRGLLPRAGRTRRLLGNSAAAVIGMVFFVPAAVDMTGVIKDFWRVDSREYLWDWSDVNVPPEGRILMYNTSVLFDAWNRPWIGYNGVTSFDWWLVDDVMEETPARWVERGIMYLALTDEDRRTAPDPAALDAYLDHLLLLKHFQPENPAGPKEIFFYRMLLPETQTDVIFGGQIRLVGYDLHTGDAAPGGTITFRPYWQIVRPPDDNYSMFVHLYPADSDTLITQADTAPTNDKRLTLLWRDPGETLIGAHVVVSLPDDLPPGAYRLAIGLYNWQTWERLRLPDGSDYLSLPVEVQ